MWGLKKQKELIESILEELQKEEEETTSTVQPSVKSNVKLVNFYSVIYNEKEKNRQLSGVLLDYLGKEYEFEWDESQSQLAYLVCEDNDSKSLMWELAERFLYHNLGLDEESNDEVVEDILNESQQEPVITEEHHQDPIKEVPTPYKDLPKTVRRSEKPVDTPDIASYQEPQDISDEVLSKAFQNLDTVQDVLDYEDQEDEEQQPLSLGDHVVLKEDPSIKGMIRMIKDQTAIVFVDSVGKDQSIPLIELTRVT